MPILQSCEDNVTSAKAVAKSMRTGVIAPLSIAISHSVGMTLMVPRLKDLALKFGGLDLVLLRGCREEVARYLKDGAVEFAIAEALDQKWDRFVSWKILSECYDFACNRHHRLANRTGIELDELAGECLVMDKSSETSDAFSKVLDQRNVVAGSTHEAATTADCMAMIGAGLGVGIVPHSSCPTEHVSCLPITDFGLVRTVAVYGVAGRQRSRAGTGFLNLFRSTEGPVVSRCSGAQLSAQLH